MFQSNLKFLEKEYFPLRSIPSLSFTSCLLFVAVGLSYILVSIFLKLPKNWAGQKANATAAATATSSGNLN